MNDVSIPELPKRYCTMCAKLMIPKGKMKIKRKDGRYDGYDSNTGKIATVAYQDIRCPDERWFNGHSVGTWFWYSEDQIGWAYGV